VTDSLGLLEEFITPESDTTRMTYDPEGRLTQHVSPDGRVTTLNRTVGEKFLGVEFQRVRVQASTTWRSTRCRTSAAG
jgi:YD repeat-containing protein